MELDTLTDFKLIILQRIAYVTSKVISFINVLYSCYQYTNFRWI